MSTIINFLKENYFHLFELKFAGSFENSNSSEWNENKANITPISSLNSLNYYLKDGKINQNEFNKIFEGLDNISQESRKFIRDMHLDMLIDWVKIKDSEIYQKFAEFEEKLHCKALPSWKELSDILMEDFSVDTNNDRFKWVIIFDDKIEIIYDKFLSSKNKLVLHYNWECFNDSTWNSSNSANFEHDSWEKYNINDQEFHDDLYFDKGEDIKFNVDKELKTYLDKISLSLWIDKSSLSVGNSYLHLNLNWREYGMKLINITDKIIDEVDTHKRYLSMLLLLSPKLIWDWELTFLTKDGKNAYYYFLGNKKSISEVSNIADLVQWIDISRQESKENSIENLKLEVENIPWLSYDWENNRYIYEDINPNWDSENLFIDANNITRIGILERKILEYILSKIQRIDHDIINHDIKPKGFLLLRWDWYHLRITSWGGVDVNITSPLNTRDITKAINEYNENN